jgi:hypothetical protein
MMPRRATSWIQAEKFALHGTSANPVFVHGGG